MSLSRTRASSERGTDISIVGSRQVVDLVDFMNMLYLTTAAWEERIFLILRVGFKGFQCQ